MRSTICVSNVFIYPAVEDRTLLHGPAYIYSIGDQICSVPAGDAQRTSVSTSSSATAFDPSELCFFGGQTTAALSSSDAVGGTTKYEFRALDYNYRRGELFFSETGFRVRTIRRAHLVERQNNSAIVHGVGLVKGQWAWSVGVIDHIRRPGQFHSKLKNSALP